MKFEFNSHDLIVQPKITLCKVDTSIIGFLDVKNLVILSLIHISEPTRP